MPESLTIEQAQEALDQEQEVLLDQKDPVRIEKITLDSVLGPECFVKGRRIRPSGKEQRFERWVPLRDLSLALQTQA